MQYVSHVKIRVPQKLKSYRDVCIGQTDKDRMAGRWRLMLNGSVAHSITLLRVHVCENKLQDSVHHHSTTVLRPFSGTTRVSRCQKRTSGLYGARED